MVTWEWMALGAALLALFGPGVHSIVARRPRHAVSPRRAVALATIDRCRGEAVTDTIVRPNPATPPSTKTMHFPEMWLHDRGDRR